MAKHQNYSVGGVNGVYVIIDEDGNVSFLDGSSKKVNGTDKLQGKAPGNVNIACSATGAGEGCVVTDGDGNVWIGPARPTSGISYGSPVAKV